MRIFSFPHVVIYELMKEFEPVGLIALSLCSKNSYAFVRNCSKIEEDLKIRDHYHGCDVCLSENVLIRVISKTDGYVDAPYFKACTSSQFLFDTCRLFFTFWKDVAQGCREATNYICDLFKIPVAAVVIEHREAEMWMLDFARKRQKQKLKTVLTFFSSNISAESYSSILSCNATETLLCFSCPPQDYRLDGKLPTVKDLTITDGFWITREHLLGLESQNLRLHRSNLKGPDVNAVLRCWLSGGLPKLKYLNLRMHVDDTIFDGLHTRLEKVQGETIYTWKVLRKMGKMESTGVLFDSNAFHIRRDDGVVATVEIGECFLMVVWPDLNGKCV